MKHKRLWPGRVLLLLLLSLLGLAALPPAGAAAAAVATEPVAGWVPISTVPPELLDGEFPRSDGLRDQARALVAKAVGRPLRWFVIHPEVPVFSRDSAGLYHFVIAIRFGVILAGSDDEVQQRSARGLFDQVIYVRAAAAQEGAGWGPVALTLAEGKAMPVPALPEGGPSTLAETVRGWRIAYNGAMPEPPIGSGLRLSDADDLLPLAQQLAGYPAEVIAGVDPADPNLVVSTELAASGAVIQGAEATEVLIVRTVNAYARAPWMDGLWQTQLSDATDHLDTAAARAGVTPAQVGSQRLLLRRTAAGWQVAEARIIPGPYTLTIEQPTLANRVIGGLDTVNVQVPASMRRPVPVDPGVGAAAATAGAVVLAAWAGAQGLAMARGRAAFGRVGSAGRRYGHVSGPSTAASVAGAVSETAGSKIAKLASDAMDWAFAPVEKPLSLLMKALSHKFGLFRYLVEEEEEPPAAAVPVAGRRAAPDGRGQVCVLCGTRVDPTWQHCTACGCRLAADPAVEAAPGGDQS